MGELLSPRIIALTCDLTAGNAAALDAFWSDVKARGTPLVEPIDGEAGHALVTFVWRPGEDYENVAIYTHLAPLVTDNLMTRMPGTDLWHKTYRVRTDVRGTYWFCPNDTLVPWKEEQDWATRSANWIADPLNPRTTPEVPLASALVMPDAPPQPWSARRPGVPEGSVTACRSRSEILGNEREVWVYTPQGYATTGEPYDLLIVFDGWAYQELIPTPAILDNLLAAGRLRPTVALLVNNAPGARDLELGCSAPFVDYLAQELLPWVHQRYHITENPKRTTIAGSSRGGLAATFAALRRPDLFGNVLSQSGAFYWKPADDPEPGWLIRAFAAEPRVPLRFSLDVGLLETGRCVVEPGPPAVYGPSLLDMNRCLRDVLQAKGYAIRYAEFSGGHDYNCWEGTLPDGLLALATTACA